MGREIKRVPLDFDWPLHDVWKGSLLPDEFHFPACFACKHGAAWGDDFSTGYTREAYAIAQTFYPHMIRAVDRQTADALAWYDKIGQAEVDNLLAEDRLRTLVKREPTEDNSRDWEWVALPRTAAEINANALNEHDAINCSILIRFRCEQLGIVVLCMTCDGQGNLATEEQRKAYDEWEGTQPPEDDGWQVWETVSEGSPISPVFATDEDCARWVADHESTSYEGALKFVRSGWAPSFISDSKDFRSGVQAMAEAD